MKHLCTNCIQSKQFSSGFGFHIAMAAYLENLVLTYRRQIDAMNVELFGLTCHYLN